MNISMLFYETLNTSIIRYPIYLARARRIIPTVIIDSVENCSIRVINHFGYEILCKKPSIQQWSHSTYDIGQVPLNKPHLYNIKVV